VLHDGWYAIFYYPIQGHGGPKIAKKTEISKSISSAGVYVIKKINGEL